MKSTTNAKLHLSLVPYDKRIVIPRTICEHPDLSGDSTNMQSSGRRRTGIKASVITSSSSNVQESSSFPTLNT